VAYAVRASRIPVVTGVGHEIDFTIADFAADRRAPTPSAAAEIVTPDIEDLRATVAHSRERLLEAMQAGLDERRRRLEGEARFLATLSPLRRIDNARQRIDDLSGRGARACQQIVARQRERLDARRKALIAADPRAILARGYAIVERAGDGARLRRAADAAPGDTLDVHFAQGSLRAHVDAISEE